MSINKPYYRIIRPFLENKKYSFAEYIYHLKYANDMFMLLRGYKIIENDLIKLFEYIEPSDENLNCYSYRSYDLLIKACMEFETNAKRILESNNYQNSNNWNITDYFKINKSSKLDEYELILDIWRPSPKILTPFNEWKINHSLKWYQEYNLVKHDRNLNFNKANLENVLNSIGGVLIILFSQFSIQVFDPYQEKISYISGDESASNENFIFKINYPKTWSDNECYDFDWNTLKNNPNPFDNFIF